MTNLTETFPARREHLITVLQTAMDKAQEQVRVEAARIAEDPSRAGWCSEMFKKAGEWQALRETFCVVSNHDKKETWLFEDLKNVWREKLLRAATSLSSRSTSTVSNLLDDTTTEAYARMYERFFGGTFFLEALRLDPEYVAAYQQQQEERNADLAKRKLAAEDTNAAIRRARAKVRTARKLGRLGDVHADILARAEQDYVEVPRY